MSEGTNGGAEAVNDLYTAALPDVRTNQRLAGLDGVVEIFRDALGIPHVRASSAHDAFYGQGFVHAQDRLWQMEWDRLRASGRWAEVSGASGITVDHDSMMRRSRIDASAQADYAAFDADTQAMFEAYTAGVNAFIDSTATLPVEFSLLGIAPQRWEPWHSGAIFKVRHILMGVWGTKLWRARILRAHGEEMVATLGRRGNEGGVLIVPPGQEYSSALGELSDMISAVEALHETPEFGGSNNWAIAPERTASGKPLVAGDPHRFIDVPSVYYQCHLACPEWDVIGFNFAGIPAFPHFAHNARVAWCITHASADYQDLYIERFRTTDGGYDYAVGDQWVAADVSRETISVLGGEPREIEVVITRHGPVIVGDPASGHAITFRYSALDRPNLGLTCLLPMLTATNLDEFEEANRAWVDPANNLTMADVDGNIGYLHRGRVPVRHAANGWLPVPGWTDAHEWTGDIAFEELPRVRNPKNGWIATANQRVAADDYPHYLSLDYAPPHRGMRLATRLATLQGATVEDMASVHADRVSLPSRTLLNATQHITADGALEQAMLDTLAGWDGGMDKTSAGAAIYAVLRDALIRTLASRPVLAALRDNPFKGEPAAFGAETRLYATAISMMDEDDDTLLGEGETWADVVSEAFAAASGTVAERLGDDASSWQWGTLHTTRPLHPLSAAFPAEAATLNPPSVHMGGDSDTVQAAGTFPGLSFHVNGTSVARYIFDLGDWDLSRWIVPLGSSGHPGSAHWADQALDWSEVRSHPMTYSWERVANEAATIQRLEPV